MLINLPMIAPRRLSTTARCPIARPGYGSSWTRHGWIGPLFRLDDSSIKQDKFATLAVGRR
jgi:hypothetical protein